MSHENSERDYKDPLRRYNPATSVILAGYRPRLSEYSVKVPLFRTSTFEFESAEEGAKFFERAYHLPGDDGEDPGLVYSRLNNPNTEIVEDKLVAGEKGANHAAVFPSGMNAIATTVLALVPQQGKILYTNPVYGGTYFLLKHLCPVRFGVETTAVETSDLKAVEQLLQKEGPFDMIFLETPANPILAQTDIAAISELARKYGEDKTLVAVDNTFLGPVFQSPFELGADLVLYSATKFLGGHSDIIAGAALSRVADLINSVRDYRTILGGTIASDTAWLLTRSIETLWVRMERQAQKATKVAEVLKDHLKIEKLLFSGLLSEADGQAYEVFRKQCHGPGSIITLLLKNTDRAGAYRFLDHLQIFHLAVSLGGTESLAEHPRSMTHSDMSEEDLDRCGISDSMVRLSVGLESSDYLVEDLMAALKVV